MLHANDVRILVLLDLEDVRCQLILKLNYGIRNQGESINKF